MSEIISRPEEEADFKSIVGAHLASLSEERWQLFRSMADPASGASKVEHPPEDWSRMTREQVVSEYTASCFATLHMVMPYAAEIETIGHINGEPVLFAIDSGIYCWARGEPNLCTIDLWLSYPAYPPGY